jgi:hypothetical protein
VRTSLSGRCALAGFLLAALLASCGGGGAKARDSGPAHTTIGGEIAARVGDLDLSATLVGAVAAERHITPAAALARLIDDAVAAKGALARRLDRAPEVRVARTSALSRAAIDRLKDSIHSSAPSDEEVRALSVLHWLEVDAPETFLTYHAVARRPKEGDPELREKSAKARAVAELIAKAVIGATDAADFEARAKAVPHPDVDVVIEALNPTTADGRVAVPGDPPPYDPRFAAGVAAISVPGTTSGVIESSFGWHVAILLEKRPARSVPFEERRRLFAEEVYAKRGEEALATLESGLSAKEGVSLASGVDELLAGALPAIRGESSP